MHQNVPELTLTAIALGLDAPPNPPMQPTDPAMAVNVCREYLSRCIRQLEAARTPLERREAELWIDNAERQLERWQAALERQGRK